MLENVLLLAKTHAFKIYTALIPAGFFVFTSSEALAVQLLFITLAIDIVLGVTLAIKFKRFSSHNMGRCIPKGIGYMLAVMILLIISRLLPEASFLLYYTLSFFILTELSSHIENLSLLGVSFPEKVMQIVNRNYKDRDTAIQKWFERNKDSF